MMIPDFAHIGQIYAGIPFDADRTPSLCMLTSVSPLDTLADMTCPVQLCDTDNTENAALICRTARERGCLLTVLLTQDGEFPCDRLLVPADLYAEYRNAAPVVGVRFSYDVKNPDILSKIMQYAGEGIMLIDAYPENPGMREEGAQQALLDELKRVVQTLCRYRQDGHPVEFLPFSVMGLYAKHGIGAHRNARCWDCSHQAVCGGCRLSFADCEVKRTLADCAVFLASGVSDR